MMEPLFPFLLLAMMTTMILVMITCTAIYNFLDRVIRKAKQNPKGHNAPHEHSNPSPR